jgi:uncharacterized protein YqgV (UPF0045/DUF77 family)
MIVNLKDTNVLTIPNPIKKVITSLSNNFIAKLYKCYIINMSFILRILYKLMCSLIEEITVRKIVVIDGKEDKRMFNFINPMNLEKRFNGEADNLKYDGENYLFPPRMPQQEKYLLSNENKKNILISEDEYIKKMNSLPEESISPYVLYHIKLKEEREKEEQIKKENEIKMKKEEEQQKQLNDKINEIHEYLKNEDWSFNYENIKINKKYDSNVDEIKNLKNNFLNELFDFNNRKKNMNWNIKEQ